MFFNPRFLEVRFQKYFMELKWDFIDQRERSSFQLLNHRGSGRKKEIVFPNQQLKNKESH